MSDKFAVIGASSFSGRAFVAHMRKHGYNVIEPEIRSLGYDVIGPEHRYYDVKFHFGLLAELIYDQNVTHVINFVALNMVEPSWLLFADYYQTNLIGIATFCDRLRMMGWQGRFTQVSTPEVYGATGGLIKEVAPFNPSTPYAVSRAAIDMHLRALHKAYGFRVLFTRSVNVYGPGQQPYRIIPKTVLKILRGEKLKLHGGGVSRRAWLHIDDAAEAIRLVALRGNDGEDYHVSTGEYWSIRDIVSRICEYLNVRFDDAVESEPERVGKDMDYQLDDSKIRSKLGWHDKVSFERGLTATVDWFKSHATDYVGKSLEYEHRP